METTRETYDYSTGYIKKKSLSPKKTQNYDTIDPRGMITY